MLICVVQNIPRLQHKLTLVPQLILTKSKESFVLTYFSPSGWTWLHHICPMRLPYFSFEFLVTWPLSRTGFSPPFHVFFFRSESGAAAHINSICRVCFQWEGFFLIIFLVNCEHVRVSEARDCWPANSNSKRSFCCRYMQLFFLLSEFHGWI